MAPSGLMPNHHPDHHAHHRHATERREKRERPRPCYGQDYGENHQASAEPEHMRVPHDRNLLRGSDARLSVRHLHFVFQHAAKLFPELRGVLLAVHRGSMLGRGVEDMLLFA